MRISNNSFPPFFSISRSPDLSISVCQGWGGVRWKCRTREREREKKCQPCHVLQTQHKKKKKETAQTQSVQIEWNANAILFLRATLPPPLECRLCTQDSFKLFFLPDPYKKNSPHTFGISTRNSISSSNSMPSNRRFEPVAVRFSIDISKKQHAQKQIKLARRWRESKY